MSNHKKLVFLFTFFVSFFFIGNIASADYPATLKNISVTGSISGYSNTEIGRITGSGNSLIGYGWISEDQYGEIGRITESGVTFSGSISGYPNTGIGRITGSGNSLIGYGWISEDQYGEIGKISLTSTTYSCPSGGTLSGTTCIESPMSVCGSTFETCTVGTPSSVNSNTWVCDGPSSNDMVVCSVAPTNGACGSSSQQYTPAGGPFDSLTSSSPNLCSTGTTSSFTGTGPWSWSCLGTGGGSTASPCTAQKTCSPSCPNPNTVCLGQSLGNDGCGNICAGSGTKTDGVCTVPSCTCPDPSTKCLGQPLGNDTCGNACTGSGTKTDGGCSPGATGGKWQEVTP